MPEISVVIPTHNRCHLLCGAIESVLKQDFTDYEIIIVDDGSIDQISTIQKARYIYQPNSGVSKARNTGIKTAKGTFVAFLDSDDLWESKKLSSQWEFFQRNPDAYMCYTRQKWVRNNSGVTPPKIYQPASAKALAGRPNDNNIIPRLLNRCFIGASSVMIRKELFDLIGYFDESMPVCEDLDLWLRIAVKHPIHFIDEPLTIKRMGDWPQLSTTTWGMDRYRIYALEKLLRTDNLAPNQKRLFLSTIHHKSHILTKGSFKHRHFGLAIKYGWKWLTTQKKI